MVKREGVTSWVGGYVEGGTLGGGGGTLVGGFVGYWSPLDERVRSSFAEKRNVESGTSTREDRSKTAQILLEKPFKNHRKK